MPTIDNATLTLTTVNDTVTADVTFDAVFTRLERNLADMGMTFDRHVDILDVDPGRRPCCSASTRPISP